MKQAAAPAKQPAAVEVQTAPVPAGIEFGQAATVPAVAEAQTAPVPAGTEFGQAATASAVAVQRLDAGGGERGGPATDPKFAALKNDLHGKQKLLTAHRPAKAEAASAAAAAKAPQDDKEAQGKAANAAKMDAAKPGEFNKAAFIRAVNDAINAQAPKNLDEADKFGDSGKASAVKEQVAGQVTDGKKASAGPIESTTNAPPDTSAAKDKPVTPLAPDKPPAVTATVDAAKAVPDKAPPEATDFSGGPKQVNEQMADAQVTEEQLARSNEPEFGDALNAKKEGEQHSAAAPGTVRAAEAQTLAGAKAQAAQEGATALTAMAGARHQAGAALTSGKNEAKGSDETRRTEATAKLQAVFDATKKDVENILTGLDKKVDDAFTAGEKAARDAFTAEHKRRMDAYKDERYSGLIGAGRWVKDKFAGLPEEANQIFVQARAGYVSRMQQVISSVADIIAAELAGAKKRIADGRAQLQKEVDALPKDLQAFGKQAAGEFAAKFDELTESVDNKGQELVQTLADKYKEALSAVDEEIAAEKEKNKGLIDKAIDAVGGVIRTILQLKEMLMGVLAKAAQAVMAILKDPIGFLGNLVSAVGSGLRAFIGNIAEHLKKGLIGWLMGAMAGAGLELPAKFDLRGILGMLASLLGLTWAAIRARIIAKGVPAQAMSAAESGVTLVQKLRSQGIGGVWEELKDKVGDLKANLLSKIKEFLIPTVLIAGITWIISLLNPASAFIKACKMIVDIVTFILERGAQIIEFVNSVLDAVIAIAGGGAGGVPALIEKALARSIPVLIGALAAILGIGGIAEKVKKFFQAAGKQLMKGVDWVVGKVANLAKKFWAKLKGRFGKKDKPDKRSPKQLEQTLDRALGEAHALIKPGVSVEEIRAKLPKIQSRHRLTSLTLTVEREEGKEKTVYFEAAINPNKKRPDKIVGGGPGLFQAKKLGPNSFTGEFANLTPAAWARYDALTTVSKHPGNDFLQRANGKVPRPTGTYTVAGAATGGAAHTQAWRDQLAKEKDDEKEILLRQNPEWAKKGMRNNAERGAKAIIEKKYGMGWNDLRLALGSWEEHHVHPVNWGGHKTDKHNLIFIRTYEHSPITTFFDKWLKSEIIKDIK